MTLSVSSPYGVEWYNDILIRNVLERRDGSLIDVLDQDFPEGAEKTTKTSVTIADVLAEIRTEHFPSPSVSIWGAS
jgi:hypothetical protein